MKMYNLFKLLSLVSYSVIMISGSMICIPLIFCLFSWMFEAGTLIQLFAILAFVAIICSFFLFKYKRSLQIVLIEIGLFAMLSSPLIERLLSFETPYFNALYFIIPCCLFVVFYFLGMGFRPAN